MDEAEKERGERKQERDATQGDHLQAVSVHTACTYPVRLGQCRERVGGGGGGGVEGGGGGGVGCATGGEPQMSSNASMEPQSGSKRKKQQGEERTKQLHLLAKERATEGGKKKRQRESER